MRQVSFARTYRPRLRQGRDTSAADTYSVCVAQELEGLEGCLAAPPWSARMEACLMRDIYHNPRIKVLVSKGRAASPLYLNFCQCLAKQY
eukprot:2457018-Pleurochrysis_carterae.AAC.6